MKVKRIYGELNGDAFILLDSEGMPIIHISEYLKYLYYEKKMESNTIKSKAQCIKQYLEFLDIIDIEYLNPPENILEKYNQYLQSVYKNKKNILSKLKIVNGLYEYLNIDYIDNNCMYTISREVDTYSINSIISEKTILTKKDVHNVLRNVGNIKEELLLNLLFVTGATSNEIINLHVNDFIEEDGMYYVQFKASNGVKKIHMIPQNIMALYFMYVKSVLKGVANNKEGFIFVHTEDIYNGKRLSTSYINKVLTNIRRKTGINVSMTTIRHFYAEFTIELISKLEPIVKGMYLDEIEINSLLMGQQSSATTDYYKKQKHLMKLKNDKINSISKESIVCKSTLYKNRDIRE